MRIREKIICSYLVMVPAGVTGDRTTVELSPGRSPRTGREPGRHRDRRQRGRGLQPAPGGGALVAPGRGAGNGARPDRHPACRRRQGQPVFPARLQPRPWHRFRHLGRRRAGRTCRRMPTAKAIPEPAFRTRSSSAMPARPKRRARRAATASSGTTSTPPTAWLAFDADLAWSHARFSESGTGGRITSPARW